jgi:hypothetical protein
MVMASTQALSLLSVLSAQECPNLSIARLQTARILESITEIFCTSDQEWRRQNSQLRRAYANLVLENEAIKAVLQ